MSDLIKEVVFRPAYDKRAIDPAKNYGIGAMQITFYLKGPLGIIQFVLGTGMYLKSTITEYKVLHPDFSPRWMGYDIGYHSPKPMYEGQSPMEKCTLLPEGSCYYDGSSLQAEEIAERFIAEGETYLWQKLEEVYHQRFEP